MSERPEWEKRLDLLDGELDLLCKAVESRDPHNELRLRVLDAVGHAEKLRQALGELHGNPMG